MDSQERRVDNSYWHLLRSGSGSGTGSLRAQGSGLRAQKSESQKVARLERPRGESWNRHPLKPVRALFALAEG